MRSSCCLDVCVLQHFLLCIRCRGNVPPGSTIPAVRRHVTLHSKVVKRGVFYAVRVESYCDMTPETEDSSLLGNGSVNRFPRK
jgi:hypothetical protein